MSIGLHSYTRPLSKNLESKIPVVYFFKYWNTTMNQQTTKILKYPWIYPTLSFLNIIHGR